MSSSLLRTAQPPLRRSWRGLAAGSISALSGIALLATSAYLITRAAEQPPILYLSIAIVSVRLFALTRAVFRYLERLTSHDAAFRQLAELRVRVYERLARIAPAGLGRTSRGDLLTRVVSDVDALQDLPLRVVQPLVISGISAVGAVAGVIIVSPRAGVVLLVGLVVAFVVSIGVADRLAQTSETSLATHRGQLGDAVLDTVQNLDVLVAFDAIDEQRRLVDRLDDSLRSTALSRASVNGLVASIVSVLSGLTVLAAIWAAGPLVGHGLAGPAFALVVLVPLAVFEVVAAVPVAVLARRRVRASADRVDGIVPAVAPAGVVVDSLDGTDLDGTEFDDAELGGAGLDAPAPLVLGESGTTALRLEGVDATWPHASSPALRDVTLEIAVGDRILVEGPSGAGKSTLAATLVRFLESTGTYEVGGRSVHDVDARAVRQTVGLIEQKPYLFDENLRQNLLFARDTATDDELLAVLARVGLAPWAHDRGGLDARMGERGALVSGGQAQRISLARALLRGFPVLVLDEPAAGVDAEVANGLLRDILTTAEAEGTTVVLISHVPVEPALVTRRVRLEAGRLTQA